MPTPDLFISCNGSNGSTTFTDTGAHGFTVTANGAAQVSTAVDPSGSLYTPNSSTDYLSVPANSVFNLGTGDFTFQFDTYITAGGNSDFVIEQQTTGAGPTNVSWEVDMESQGGGGSGGQLGFICTADGTTVAYSVAFGLEAALTTPFPTNQWLTFTLVRTSGTMSAYMNGYPLVLGTGSSASNSTNIYTSSLPVDIFCPGGTTDPCYARNVEFYSGAAVPPPAPPVSIATSSGQSNQTAQLGTAGSSSPSNLLLHFDGAQGSGTVLDSGQYNVTVTNATPADNYLDTTNYKFGGSSLFMSGAAQGPLTTDPNIFTGLGGGDFMIDCWIKTSQTNYGAIYSHPGNGGGFGPGAFVLFTISNNYGSGHPSLYLETYSSGAPLIDSASIGGICDGNWHYIEWSFTTDTHYLWVDGNLAGSRTVTAFPEWGTGYEDLFIGTDNVFSSQIFTGNIDEFHIVGNGIGFGHTAPYTPPTAPWGGSSGGDPWIVGYASTTKSSNVSTTLAGVPNPWLVSENVSFAVSSGQSDQSIASSGTMALPVHTATSAGQSNQSIAFIGNVRYPSTYAFPTAVNAYGINTAQAAASELIGGPSSAGQTDQSATGSLEEFFPARIRSGNSDQSAAGGLFSGYLLRVSSGNVNTCNAVFSVANSVSTATEAGQSNQSALVHVAPLVVSHTAATQTHQTINALMLMSYFGGGSSASPECVWEMPYQDDRWIMEHVDTFDIKI